MKVALLSAGKDKPYALGVVAGLLNNTIKADFIGNSEMQTEKIFLHHDVTYYNLRGVQEAEVPIAEKIKRVLLYYCKLIRYAGYSDARIFHILWLNKFLFFDSTLLNIYYKLLGKKIVYTAHNVNMKKRDGKDSLLNRISLKFLYNIVDHIFVHTQKMKDELQTEFGVQDKKITVHPFGINNTLPNTDMDCYRAKELLKIQKDEIALLFFGNIAPYKGLDILIEALQQVVLKGYNVRLIIAGRIKESVKYWEKVSFLIKKYNLKKNILEQIEYIPDEKVEIYFKAADAIVLPYQFIYQSGPLFLAYNFGLPVIANNVGTFKEDIAEGKTGFVSKGKDAENLAEAIEKFIQSNLYKDLSNRRDNIKKYAMDKYSWDSIAKKIIKAYQKALQ